MVWRKIGPEKYKIEVEKTVDGERYRKTKTIKCSFTGLKLKSFMNAKELDVIQELYAEIGSASYAANLSIFNFGQWYIKNHKLEENTISWYNSYLKNQINSFFEDKPIKNITERDVKDFNNHLMNYISERTKKPYAPKTIKHNITVLKSLFNVAVEEGILEKNPAENVKNVKVQKSVQDKYYSPSEMKKALKYAFKEDDVNFILCIVLTVTYGLRPAELRGLKWTKIEWTSKRVMIDDTITVVNYYGYDEKGTKNNEPRVGILTPMIEELLKLQIKEQKKLFGKKCEFVVHSTTGDHLANKTFRDNWKKFCKKIGLRYLPPYGLRHTTATLLASQNVSIPNIADVMGHKNLSTTEIYIHAIEEEKGIAYNIINDTIGGRDFEREFSTN